MTARQTDRYLNLLEAYLNAEAALTGYLAKEAAAQKILDATRAVNTTESVMLPDLVAMREESAKDHLAYCQRQTAESRAAMEAAAARLNAFLAL